MSVIESKVLLALRQKLNRAFLKFKNYFYLSICLHKWKFEKKHPKGCLTLSANELGLTEQWVWICTQDHQCLVLMQKGYAGKF